MVVVRKKKRFFWVSKLSRAVLCSALLTSLLTYLLTYLLATCLPAWLRLTKLLTYYLNYCVLFVSPSLTWRDVQHIIVRSARHTPEGVPLTSGFWVKNKAGLWFSRYFGFGLMDWAWWCTWQNNGIQCLHNWDVRLRAGMKTGLDFFLFCSLLLLMISKYRKRSISNESFYVKFSRTHKMSASFTRIGTQIWNSTPYLIKTLKRSFSGKR